MMKRDEQDRRIVYSTEHGRMCPNCKSPISECTCRKKKEIPRGDGIVRVGIEKKGRKGKSVTVISGVSLGHGELQKLGKSLKRKCGAGGTVKGGVVEIQGNHRGTVMEELKEMGYVVKRSGG